MLARLLVPADFETIALSICQFFTLVSDFGLAAAIIQDKTSNDRDYDDIFSFTVRDCC
ncbi:oligosaccharide flippase family protein [Alistipes ihumii]|uniref:oligosaccharide flippase family protein n=1 Tax=Alistipes ihumii TaxID=1470347 RepID=UPI0009DA78AD